MENSTVSENLFCDHSNYSIQESYVCPVCNKTISYDTLDDYISHKEKTRSSTHQYVNFLKRPLSASPPLSPSFTTKEEPTRKNNRKHTRSIALTSTDVQRLLPSSHLTSIPESPHCQTTPTPPFPFFSVISHGHHKTKFSDVVPVLEEEKTHVSLPINVEVSRKSSYITAKRVALLSLVISVVFIKLFYDLSYNSKS